MMVCSFLWKIYVVRVAGQRSMSLKCRWRFNVPSSLTGIGVSLERSKGWLRIRILVIEFKRIWVGCQGSEAYKSKAIDHGIWVACVSIEHDCCMTVWSEFQGPECRIDFLKYYYVSAVDLAVGGVYGFILAVPMRVGTGWTFIKAML